MSDRCPYCSFDPTSLNDYCNEHRPKEEAMTPPDLPPDVQERLKEIAEMLRLVAQIHNTISAVNNIGCDEAKSIGEYFYIDRRVEVAIENGLKEAYRLGLAQRDAQLTALRELVSEVWAATWDTEPQERMREG